MHPRRRPRQLGKRLRRCLIVSLALLGYCAAALGVPLPQVAFHTSTRIASAQKHRCGCHMSGNCQAPCCCCGSEHTADPAIAEEETSAAPNWVLGISARKCRGEDSSWLSIAPALPPPAEIAWHYCWDIHSWLPLDIDRTATRTMPPPIPPPRA